MKVVLMVNSGCNARCQHCYIPYTSARSPENALNTIAQLQENGHEVIVAGSEVLLDERYLACYEKAGQKYLLTNGIVLGQRPGLFERIRAHGIEELVISLHFDIDRSLRSVPDRVVKEHVIKAKRKGFRVKVVTIVTPGNCMSIASMCARAVEMGADTLQFNRFVRMGRGENRPELGMSAEQIDAFFAQIEEARDRYPRETLCIRPHGTFGPRAGSKGERLAHENRYCPAGIDLAAVDPDNKVYGCPFSMKEGAVIGYHENGKIIIEGELLCGKRNTCIAHELP